MLGKKENIDIRSSKQHEVIIYFWVIVTVILSIPDIKSAPAIILSIYVLVSTWFMLAWRRNEVMNNHVKIVAGIGMIICFFLSYGSMLKIIELPKLTIELPKYIYAINILSNEFVVVFIAVLIICPLILSIFHKHYMYTSLIVVTPVFFIEPYNNFSTLDKTCFTIGFHSAKVLAVLAATHLSSIIFRRFFKPEKSNQKCESKVSEQHI